MGAEKRWKAGDLLFFAFFLFSSWLCAHDIKGQSDKEKSLLLLWKEKGTKYWEGSAQSRRMVSQCERVAALQMLRAVRQEISLIHLLLLDQPQAQPTVA